MNFKILHNTLSKLYKLFIAGFPGNYHCYIYIKLNKFQLFQIVVSCFCCCAVVVSKPSIRVISSNCRGVDDRCWCGLAVDFRQGGRWSVLNLFESWLLNFHFQIGWAQVCSHLSHMPSLHVKFSQFSFVEPFADPSHHKEEEDDERNNFHYFPNGNFIKTC